MPHTHTSDAKLRAEEQKTATTTRRHLQETSERFPGFLFSLRSHVLHRGVKCHPDLQPGVAAAPPMVRLCVSGHLCTNGRPLCGRIASLQPQKCPPTSCTHGCTLRSRATHTVCYHDIFSHFKAMKSVLQQFHHKMKQSNVKSCVVPFLCFLQCICHMWTDVCKLLLSPFIPPLFLFITALW